MLIAFSRSGRFSVTHAARSCCSKIMVSYFIHGPIPPMDIGYSDGGAKTITDPNTQAALPLPGAYDRPRLISREGHGPGRASVSTETRRCQAPGNTRGGTKNGDDRVKKTRPARH